MGSGEAVSLLGSEGGEGAVNLLGSEEAVKLLGSGEAVSRSVYWVPGGGCCQSIGFRGAGGWGGGGGRSVYLEEEEEEVE